MSGRFLDANVLVYLASGNARKADFAERQLAEGGTVSVQAGQMTLVNPFGSA